MDKVINTKLINENLLCEKIVEVDNSNFFVESDTRFSDLKVLESSVEGVKKGDIIVVPSSSIKDINNYLIVKKRDIIYIK